MGELLQVLRDGGPFPFGVPPPEFRATGTVVMARGVGVAPRRKPRRTE